MVVLGLDVGTGSAKAVAFEAAQGIRGRGSAGYETHKPQPGWAEQDPEDWWAAAARAIRAALQAAERSASDVTSLAISAMGGATVALDGSGDPVQPALINLDRRATEELRDLQEGPFADAVASASGNTVGAWNVGAKVTWLMRHRPDAFRRTRTITSPAGYLLRRCTGRTIQSVSDAGIFDLFDLSARAWSSSACEALGLDRALLPDVVASLEHVAQLRENAAEDLGLTPRCTVVAGAEDTAAAALAVGATDAATGYVSLGTAGVVGIVTTTTTAAQPRVLRFPHVLAQQDLLAGSMSTAGEAMRWLGSITGSSVSDLLASAETVTEGANGVVFLPYLAGELHPINDPDARGVFTGLSIDTTPADLARAVIEGSANAIAHNLSTITEVTHLPDVLRVTGRPASSAAWCRSIADATAVPVETVTDDGAPLGDALLAAASSEAEVRELASIHAVVHEDYVPRAEHTAAARERHALAQRLYAASSARPDVRSASCRC